MYGSFVIAALGFQLRWLHAVVWLAWIYLQLPFHATRAFGYFTFFTGGISLVLIALAWQQRPQENSLVAKPLRLLCAGREVSSDAGLPLGVLPGVEYGETVVPGDRFTFLSDGVVEAANAQGELFGFDRTREISGKAAGEIAEAAKAWGQNDDITVVTVLRNG